MSVYANFNELFSYYSQLRVVKVYEQKCSRNLLSVGKYFCRLRNVFVEREVYFSGNKLEKYFGRPRSIFVGGIFLPVHGREYVNSINSWQIYFSSDKMIFGHFWALWLSLLVLNEWFPRFQMGIKYEIKNQ